MPAQSMPPFAILYARVSREEQRKGHSLDGQIGQLERFCASSGVPIAGQYIEQSSGRVAPALRPLLSQALQDSKGGALVLWRLDRLSRDLADCATLLKATDRRIVTLEDGWNPDPLTQHVRALVGHQEVAAIRQRISMGLQAKKAKGEPLGHTLHADPLAIVRAREAGGATVKAQRHDYVRSVANVLTPMLASGATMRAIAEQLTAAGVPLPRGGSAWDAPRVCRLVKDMRELGLTP